MPARHDLKMLLAASFDARFLVMAACSRSISALSSAIRSESSSTDSSERSCPISWLIFFLGLSSSSIAMMRPPWSLVSRSGCQPPCGWLIRSRSGFPSFARTNHGKAARANDRHRHQQARRPRRAGTRNPRCPGASDLPGLEVAGEVVAVGTNARKHRLGDKVMSLVAGGGYAQYCLAQDAQAMAVPAALSMQEAGATPETLMTVWHNVFERGALQPGETLLIHGGSS